MALAPIQPALLAEYVTAATQIMPTIATYQGETFPVSAGDEVIQTLIMETGVQKQIQRDVYAVMADFPKKPESEEKIKLGLTEYIIDSVTEPSDGGATIILTLRKDHAG